MFHKHDIGWLASKRSLVHWCLHWRLGTRETHLADLIGANVALVFWHLIWFPRTLVTRAVKGEEGVGRGCCAAWIHESADMLRAWGGARGRMPSLEARCSVGGACHSLAFGLHVRSPAHCAIMMQTRPRYVHLPQQPSRLPKVSCRLDRLMCFSGVLATLAIGGVDGRIMRASFIQSWSALQ